MEASELPLKKKRGERGFGKNAIHWDIEKHAPMLYALGKEGLHYVSFCSEIGISMPSFAYWRHKNPECKEVFMEYRNLCKIYWEKLGRDGITNPDFNGRLYNALCKRTAFDVDCVELLDFKQEPDPLVQICYIEKQAAQGHISPRDASFFIDIVMKKTDLIERLQLVKDVEELKRIVGLTAN